MYFWLGMLEDNGYEENKERWNAYLKGRVLAGISVSSHKHTGVPSPFLSFTRQSQNIKVIYFFKDFQCIVFNVSFCISKERVKKQ